MINNILSVFQPYVKNSATEDVKNNLVIYGAVGIIAILIIRKL